jgi:tRNA nucleotidyltransferase (CCA-adding enzyme)
VKIYSVGGAVRDQLLGLPVKDRDYVVVGATPEDMEKLGYKPVGRDFPVFLHPRTHEEYALARTERKVARGYKGFAVHAAPDVTLEEDLARRDLTINAMARDEHGQLIDPNGGARDLEAKLLRHVSPAFVEDPVRILRVARFAARFDFAVAPETMALMRQMVREGEADALVPERVWQEFSKGLMEPHAVRMFEVLADCGLLPGLLPELDIAFERHARGVAPANSATRRLMDALRHAASEGRPLEARFALLAFALRDRGENAARSLAARLRASNECRDALLLAALHGEAVRALGPGSSAETVLGLLEAGDAFRRPERLQLLLSVCASAEFGDRGRVDQPYPPAAIMQAMLSAAMAVDAAGIARKVTDGVSSSGENGVESSASRSVDIGAQVREARLAAIRSASGRV